MDGVGANTANVLGFFDWAESQHFYQPDKQIIESGLEFVEALSIAHFKTSFILCTLAQQDEILGQLETIAHPSARRFFESLVALTIAGFLCPPRYGGNKNMIGWVYIGLVS
jgi:hypothetical protein